MITKRIKDLICGVSIFEKGEKNHYQELQWYACEQATKLMRTTGGILKESLDESIRLTLDYAEDNGYFMDDHELFLIIRKVSNMLYGGAS